MSTLMENVQKKEKIIKNYNERSKNMQYYS